VGAVRRLRWFEAACAISRPLLGEVRLSEALDGVTARAAEVSAADFVALGLLDRIDRTSVVYDAVVGLGLESSAGVQSRLTGPVRQAIRSNHPVVVDITHERSGSGLPEWAPQSWRPHLAGLTHLLFLPLRSEVDAYGCMILAWSADRVEHDEIQLAQVFADHTAMMVLKARADEERIRHERWLNAASKMAGLLLGEVDRDDAMRTVVRELREVSGADLAGIVLVDTHDQAHGYIVVFEGLPQQVPPDLRIPRDGLIASTLMSRRRIVSTDFGGLAGFHPPADWVDAFSTVGLGMLFPLVISDDVFGVLLAAWKRGSVHEQPAAGEVEQVQIFADLAAVALHRVRAELDRGHLMLLEERDRIARELNDIVLQRLFAAELRLDALRSLCSPQVQERLAQVIEHLDETNHQVRAAIFEHQAGGHT